MKRTIAIILTLILTTLFVACSDTSVTSSGSITLSGSGNAPSVEVVAGDVDIWSAPGTEKVLQDKLTGYDDIKGDAKIELYTAKGEYEGQHLILTSKTKPVTGIDVSVSNLTHESNSTVKFPKENIEVFFEKYVEVKKIYENNGATTGKYPDALIPMKNIVEYGENKMEAGTNQGLYVRFNVPKDQLAGKYTGNLTLNYAGLSKTIPVTLEVANLTISEETHARSYFISEWQYRLGELDSTQAMLEKYIQAGLEYRISPAGVVIDKTFDDEGINYYVETAAKYMKDPRCTHVALPQKSKTQTVVVNGESLTASAPDPVIMEKILDAFIKKSFEDNFDYVSKLGSHLVDEPQLNNALTRTKVATTIFKNTLKKVADKLEAESHSNATLKAKLVNSVRNVRAIITASYADEYADYIDTWCPTVDYYNTESQRAKYADQEEKWWYTCISPRAPYPTYHTEDTLLSARTLSWMQAEYDVVGNLFWATNVYANYTGSYYENIDDFYEGDASRFSQVNGDGYLFYPGKPYGVDGPIGSLRLEAIRDGIEEYEVLYALKNDYKAISASTGIAFDAKNAIRNLATDLYSGTQVDTTSEKFDAARKALYQLAMMGSSSAKASIIEYSDDNYGNITYKIFAANGYDVYNGQTKLTATQTVTGGKVYSVVNQLNSTVNKINLKVTNGSATYIFDKNLGGKVTVTGAESFASSFAKDTAGVSATLVDANGVNGESGKLVKIDVNSTTEGIQRIKFNTSVISSLNANSKKVVLRIYCKGLSSSGESFNFSVKTQSGKPAIKELATVNLKNGWNVVEVSLAGLNFDNHGALEYGLFRFGTKTAKTIYLKDVTVYNK